MLYQKFHSFQKQNSRYFFIHIFTDAPNFMYKKYHVAKNSEGFHPLCHFAQKWRSDTNSKSL